MERVWLPRVDTSLLSIQKSIVSQQHSILLIRVQNKVPKICSNWNIRSRSTGQRTRLWFILLDFVNRLSCLTTSTQSFHLQLIYICSPRIKTQLHKTRPQTNFNGTTRLKGLLSGIAPQAAGVSPALAPTEVSSEVIFVTFQGFARQRLRVEFPNFERFVTF
ncbi:Hypothetical_protein [Hexamita inflata]|nr:Hypothetical protein HINF_LOCUS42963 [Hexamita inflata]